MAKQGEEPLFSSEVLQKFTCNKVKCLLNFSPFCISYDIWYAKDERNFKADRWFDWCQMTNDK